MFAGVEILNECNYCTKGQNGANLLVPEIQVSLLKKLRQKFYIDYQLNQMSLINNEEELEKANGKLSDAKVKVSD